LEGSSLRLENRKNNYTKEKTMKMKTLLGLVVGAVFAVSAGTVWALPDLVPGPNGSTAQWSVQFFLEPNHTTGSTQCIVFRKTGGVLGEPKSGTWFSPSFAGWQGQWIQEGDNVRWYGSTSTRVGTAEFGALTNGTFCSGEFAHFLTPSGATSSAGSWLMIRRNCANDSVTAPGITGAGDPAQTE
jgi:hypothetical protein